MKKVSLLLLVLIILISACAIEQPEEVAELEAPTETAVPATDTPEPLPTNTLTPTDTPAPTSTLEPTATHTAVPTNTPVPEPAETASLTLSEDWNTIESELINSSIHYPAEWVAEELAVNDIVFIASSSEVLEADEFSNGALGLFFSLGNIGVSIEDLADALANDVSILSSGFIENPSLVGDVELFETPSGMDAVLVETSGIMPSTGEPISLLNGSIGNEDRLISMVVLIQPDLVEEVKPIYRNILASIEMGDSRAAEELQKADIYLVDSYDPSRDPAKDVQKAVQNAEQSNRRVLLIVGGDWCIDCFILDDFIVANPAVADALERNYVIVKVNVSEENANEAFLEDYPDIEWFPHFYILESDGSLADSYDTRGLSDDGDLNLNNVMLFLDEWHPETSQLVDSYVVKSYDPERDPTADIDTAVTRAQAENKNIMLIVGGEWCPWCHILEDYLETNQTVADLVLDNYLIVKINVSLENENVAFMETLPEVAGYPHLFVLDQSGE
ncbi:MAG: thioredoxin family protein, partial [Chloroflexota bacterium]